MITKNLIRNILIFIIFGLTLISCRQSEVDGIIIGNILYENRSYSENKELVTLIKQTLRKDEKALSKLNNFWCGGGAGCYDLGIVVTQIIYRLGENEFIEMADKLDYEEVIGFEGLIQVGLEYGDHDRDGRSDNNRIENEFPKLLKLLHSKRKNE